MIILLTGLGLINLSPLSQAFCIIVWQRALFHCPGRLLYIIIKPDEFRLYGVSLQNAAIFIHRQHHISSLRIAVLGFAYGSDIDRMPEMILPVNAGIQNTVVRLMGMSETHY